MQVLSTVNIGLGKNNSSKLKPNQLNSIYQFQESPSKQQLKNQKTNNNIYQAILGEIGQPSHKYLNKLAASNSKTKMNRQLKQLKNHERAKSYADMVYSSFSKKSMDKSEAFSCQKQSCSEEDQESKKQIKIQSVRLERQKARFFDTSKRNSEEKISQKNTMTAKQKNFETPRQINNDEDFIGSLDNYIQQLNNSKLRRNSKQIPNQKVKLLKKLESYQKKFKQLQLSSHMEIKKLKKKEQHLKSKVNEMHEYIENINNQLEQEKQERKKLEYFFFEFQNRMKNLKSQKKLNKKYPSSFEHSKYQDAQEIQQNNFDDSQSDIEYETIKTFKHKKVLEQEYGNKKLNRFFKNKGKQTDYKKVDIDVSDSENY